MLKNSNRRLGICKEHSVLASTYYKVYSAINQFVTVAVLQMEYGHYGVETQLPYCHEKDSKH